MIDFSLYLVTDKKLAGDRSLAEVVQLAIAGGATIVQYREKNASTREMIQEVLMLQKITKRAQIPLIIDDRVDIALTIDAEGVHVGQSDMPTAVARKMIGPNKILGVTAKTVEQAIQAEKDGADYLGVGDIFGTTSKLDAGKPIGLSIVKKIAQNISIPFVGIGAVSLDNADDVIQAGANGVAVISAIVSAPDPQKAAQDLRTNVDKALQRKNVKRLKVTKNKFIGEFELINKLTKDLHTQKREIVMGIGDDSAVIKLNNETSLLATIDAQVEKVHFLSDKVSPMSIGGKAMAINISDIAAMGGSPTYGLVSLFLPKQLSQSFIAKVYSGLKDEAKKYGVSIVGGNITRADQFSIDIALLGKVKTKSMLLRSTANTGDKVLVTGSLGDAAAGLHLLQHPEISLIKKIRDVLIAKQTTPTPRLKEATIIAQSGYATSMVDISDGLTQDMLHIASQSTVGVMLYEEKLPLSKELLILSQTTHINPVSLALSGGEDYELLFTVRPEKVTALKKLIVEKTNTSVHEIGEITAKEKGAIIINKKGKKLELTASGWDHLR